MALPHQTDNQHARGTSSLDESVSAHQWETAILNIMTSSAKRIAVVEKDLSIAKSDLAAIKYSVDRIEKSIGSKDNYLNQSREILHTVKTTMKLYRWIRNATVIIALSLVANLIYTLLI